MEQYKFGFFMDQIAGHITNYLNHRAVVSQVPGVTADWYEIEYLKETGAIERVRERFMPFVPTYFTGIMRGSLETYRALRHIREYDAILTNVSVAGLFGWQLRKVPTLIDFDVTPLQLDRLPGYSTARPDPKPLEAFKKRLFLSKARAACLLQAWSNWARDSAITEYGIPPEKVVVNPPGINLDFWKPAHEVGRSQGEPFRVLFVGGDFKRKGGELLLEWYKSQDPARCELHLVTREPVAPSPGVYVYNDLKPNTERLIRLYQSSDLFVLPSLGECFGLATVEAMGAGLPVIATDVGGTADIVESGRNGFIIPSDDLAALAQAIAAVQGDLARGLEMGRQSRLLATQRFDVNQNALKTLDNLKQIAGRPSPIEAPGLLTTC